MDGLHEFLEELRRRGFPRQGHFLGFLHVMIGRRIETADGCVISTGLTWRELARLLKRLRWDPESVRELGLDPLALPPRDRERYWYSAIAQARVDSEKARQAGNRFGESLRSAGYVLGAAPAVNEEK
jgi:hypothetical protein